MVARIKASEYSGKVARNKAIEHAGKVTRNYFSFKLSCLDP